MTAAINRLRRHLGWPLVPSLPIMGGVGPTNTDLAAALVEIADMIEVHRAERLQAEPVGGEPRWSDLSAEDRAEAIGLILGGVRKSFPNLFDGDELKSNDPALRAAIRHLGGEP